ncbi:MAG TPA: hypothetical protein VKE22_10605 [Haliangiales bacterium]|nr:hypothetical protein [Haliangiales bacterium]
MCGAELAGAAPAESCDFYAVPPVPAIVKGAHQRLRIVSSKKCIARLRGVYSKLREKAPGERGPSRLTLRNAKGDVSIEVEVAQEAIWPAPPPESCDLTFAVPATLAANADWIIAPVPASDKDVPMSLHAPVVEVTATPGMGLLVRYDDPTIDRLQTDAGTGTMAVVNPRFVDEDGQDERFRQVVNTARLTIPTELGLRPSDRLSWNVARTNWTRGVRFESCYAMTVAKKVIEWSPLGCQIEDPERLGFTVGNKSGEPLVATLEIERVYDTEEQRNAAPSNPWLDVPVKLAEGARYESVPAPIRDSLDIVCAGDSQRSVPADATRAVDDEAIGASKCKVRLIPKSRLADPSAAVYGPQVIQVTVHRDGATKDGSTSWSFNPGADAPPITLPKPEGDENAHGVYDVTVRVDAKAKGLVYRPGSDAFLDDTQYIFHARLRPRGPFGYRAPIRTFVTIPLNITGVRFPANASQLRSSSDAVSYQAVTLQTGVLVGIEPWNYDDGKNKWSLPIRFLGGLNLLDVKNGHFVPSSVLGLSIAMPLIESPQQLGTSIALGFFWEIDLTSPTPLAYGHRFLVTFGFNVFSLFGAK